MFEATQDGLGKNAPVHSIHGSLLAVGELLRNTGEFMMSRYREVAEIVLRYLEHRDRLVRLSITSLLPRIAHFLRDRFVTNYLTICMNHILSVLKVPQDRDSGFIALGEMAGALDGELIHYLPTITTHLRDAIAPRRSKPSLEALACIGSIAKAMGPAMEPHVRGLLDIMFSTGLSTVLVEALEQICTSIPSLLPTIQDRLLDSISMVLLKSHYHLGRLATSMGRGTAMNASQQFSELSSSALVQLALQTLARFNFKGHDLLEFVRESVVLYLDDEDGATRKDAALCCCKIVSNSLSGILCAHFGSSRLNRSGGGKRRRLVEELVEKILISAVADADVIVRHSIFTSLHGDRGFDEYLAQADNLSAVFAALNDEDFDVREYAISVAGRLSEKNPAYVLPALRRHLIQLLTYLEQSADSKCKEESAKLLGCLIRNCERLILPYIAPVHKALVARLNDVNANTGIVSGVLVTVGDLARVGGFAMRQYIPELMPLIVEALLDGAAVSKREVAVATLGQVVQSTGYVITPYNEYPQLLVLLLKLLNGELVWSTRREVLKVLGIMGALDPHMHKRNQKVLPGPHGEIIRPASDSNQQIQTMDEFPADLWPSFASSDDYYSTVAINSLMRILRDPSLNIYHLKVIGSLMFIFKSLGLGCVPYLPKVLPDLFHTVRAGDENLKDFITWKLGTLVSIVRQHIRKYLQDLLSLISEFWSSFTLPAQSRPHLGYPVLHLVEQLCLALNDEFRTYLPIILPGCIQVISDAERCNDYTYVLDILHTLEVFGGTLDEHMHLLLPALIRLFKVDASVDIRRAAIKTLTRLIPRVQVTGHISSLVHHLKLVLDGKNDELRKDAIDALCCLAHALGEDFTIFIPSIHKLLLKYRLRHKEFEEIEGRLKRREPLILGTTASQRLNRRLPVEVISDPLKDSENDPYEDGSDARKLRGHQVNDGRLRTAGEASQRSTKEDWAEWMRHFSIQLLKESPSPALRTCARLAQLQPFVGRELFAAGFVSCWAQLNETSQKQLVRNLEMAFSSPNIPPEILATLLNLAEFMEHDEKPLPIDIRLLGALAEKCRAFAKALHYKEMEFEGARSKKMDANPVAVVEALIHINNQLHQHEAADGILTYAQQHLDFQLKESWYEKLQRWDDALMAYTAKASQATSPHLVLDATLGRMRCLASLARWEELNNLCKEYWTPAEPAARLEMASMAANAAWNMGEWDQMAEYVSRLDDGDETKLRGLGNTSSGGDGSSDGTFFRAVLLVRIGKYDEAREYVERARKCLATELAALVLESYERAYSNMVRVQQLSELEEVIDYRTLPIGDRVAEERRALIRNMWTQRIQGAKSNVEVWQVLLAVRALVLPPVEDIETWLKFASLCRKNGRISQARSTLVKLLQYDPEISPENVRYHGPPQVMLAYLKYQWSLGEDSKRREAFVRLQNLAMELSSAPNIQPVTSSGFTNGLNPCVPLLARVNLILGSWQWSLSPGLDDESIKDILDAFANATQYSNKWAKAWHKWALFNTAVMSHYTLRGFPDVAAQFVVAAVTGYFHSIACAANAKGVDDSLQDILRLLTLWFNHGATAEVQMALKKGFSLVNINTWLVVLPQIIARIHSNNHAVRELIQSLLVRIGQNHPQALMYPLLVACKSISNLRKAAAQEVVDKVRQRSGVLVDQAQLVSKELIRVAILWHETWHEALEEASRLYFGEHNIEGMLKVLEPLHEMLEEGAMRNNVTIKERIFIEAYRQELLEAYECCVNYKRTGKDAELTQAWDIYYHVFRKIDKQLQSLTTLDLESVSPELLECRNLELAVPGTYRADAPVVTIASFARQLVVITSKQRPRKLTIHGSDGDDYAFLLKGHEDLRQDERVMQLFGLVNTLLENSRKTAEKDLSIERYAVIPLSPNSGLIEWVPNCDTLHHLIREYRDARKITLNQEHKCMLSFAPDYDHLPLIAKVEVFEFALDNTEGNDLARVLWLKSRTSEIWLERRTNYTRSLAVMSMVGYLLGLGDRHPSNLMLHRFSGKILHIDFGDCFEASMNREKFPEKVPFRLTRMLEKAMEVSGIEGNFRSTCENVMQVLRTNKDSVMAMMEAFVHDPLINWRLFNFNEVPQMSMLTSNHVTPAVNTEESAQNRELPHPQRGARERELLQAVNQLGDANEVLNERAVVVMARMSNKLTGRDFSTSSVPNSSLQHAVDHSSLVSGDTREVDHALSVKLQVQKLIVQATSHENLCQNYVGWCPFW
ncbi:putative non-specific serine/threonine protein kinase [Lupinus albus]|uniref:Serine/threonine-protein kinase TOR n=1 Tax=Lupinus albus TaxID=3870 RepID=A0A6A4P4Q0_LUPAL|nr:putative non-specific serine/threonine protein kinase [Lupinus albus]